MTRALNVEDLRRIARRRLPKVVYDYVEGGAEDGVALKANRRIFDHIRFAPRTLVDTSRRTQHVSIFGRVYESPIGIAPMAAAGLLWHDGDIALARAARSVNLPFVLSMQSLVPLPRLAVEAGGPPWFQLYMPRERAAAQSIVQRALDYGCEACVLTTDVPVNGNREYNERNGFGRPLYRAPLKALDGLLHPRWLVTVYGRRLWRHELPRASDAASRRDHASWEDLAWLRDQWPRKLLVKGLLSVEDAELAAKRGVDGLIVSNHGGRQLDGVPAPMEVLPQIAAAVGDKLVVGVDSGFRRGSDVVKALALGADIVFVGRAAAYGLAAAGEPGVRRALQLLRSEIDRVLALLGCPSIDSLGPQYIRAEMLEAAQHRPASVARLRIA
jgi:isopentenyl diphosphate isomerase/L-lactate dehydrogenase-like FMN-dependent dehydrogenase